MDQNESHNRGLLQELEALRTSRDLFLALSATGDLSAALHLVLEAACRIEGIDAGNVYLRDQRTEALDLVAHRGLPSQFVEQVAHYEITTPLARRVLAGHSVYQRESDLFPSDDGLNELYRGAGVRALAAIPVSHEGRIIAVLNLTSYTHDEIPIDARMSLEAMAAHLGATLTRAQAEAALQRYRMLAENSRDIILFIRQPDGRILEANSAAVIAYGYPVDELLSIGIQDLRAAETHPLIVPQMEQAGSAGILFETVHRRKDGTVFPVEVSSQGTTIGNERVLLSIVRDLTERKRAEEALRESAQFVRQIISSAEEGILVCGHDLRFVLWNPFMERLSGVKADQVVGRHPLELFPFLRDQGIYPLLERALAGETVSTPDYSYQVPGSNTSGWAMNQYLPYRNASGEIVGVIGLVHDITERKRAEEGRRRLENQMQHAQKLESLGVLAGGIAHDFNNLLVAILGHADLGLLQLPSGSPASDNLLEIETAARRAADLCKQMLAYSGKGRFVVEPLNLSHLVEEMAQMLEIAVSKKAVLKYHFAANLPAIHADATQVRQVIMNLITNASEAIGDRMGVIAVTTGAEECDRLYLSETYLDDQLLDGLFVCLSVSDTGIGMDAETRARIFEPFFTTKFTGRGLGLAAVLGIVRGHKGAIKVYSEPGRGTTIKVLFPATTEPAENMQEAVPATQAWQGRGTVLIVDDEESVRAVGKQMLEWMGFTVLTAADGRAALEVFQKHEDEIVCVLLDLTMPNLDGEETFRELRLLRSDVRVIMSSGYNEQEVTQRFVGKRLAGFIQKPYRLEELRRVMRAVLGSAAG